MADQDSSAADTTSDEAKQAQAACAAMLEAVATALADLAVSVRAMAEQMRPASAADGDHTCRMPNGAPLLTIHRCPCGKSYRLYPPGSVGHPSAEQGLARWREI